MKIVNLTPHDVVMVDSEGNVLKTYPKSGQTARCTTTTEIVGELDGFPVARTVFGDVEGLPESEEGTTYIVSFLVAQAVKRDDVIAPDTTPGSVVRNADGQIVGVQRFQR